MSPNEFQLRAALRDGEGDGLDPEVAIGRALQVRHARRVRIASVAAAIVLAGGISGGIVAINRSSDDLGQRKTAAAPVAGGGDLSQPAATSAPAAAASAPGSYAAAASAPQAPPVPAPSESSATGPGAPLCPATVPVLSTPAGTGQFGTGGPLFSQPVASLTICGYGVPDAVTLVTLTGTDAATFAASLEEARKQPTGEICPNEQLDARTHLVVVGVSTSGTRLPPVVVTLACDGETTNGTAVRYDWSPPAAFGPMVKQLTGQRGTQDSIAPKRADGSPPA